MLVETIERHRNRNRQLPLYRNRVLLQWGTSEAQCVGGHASRGICIWRATEDWMSALEVVSTSVTRKTDHLGSWWTTAMRPEE
jgi:hypothetical protein